MLDAGERSPAVKRLLTILPFLLFAVTVHAVSPHTATVVEEVIRLTGNGATDDLIIAYMEKSPEAFDVTGDDVVAMNEARVSPAVIRAVIDESAARKTVMWRGESGSSDPDTRVIRETQTVLVAAADPEPYVDEV